MTGPADPVLSEVVLERDGRVLAAYRVRRGARGEWVLLDQGRPQSASPGGGGGRERAPGERRSG